jgi:NAD kinase
VPFLPADFAVGAGGTILHYDGTSWTAQASGTTNDLYFVAVLDSSDAYALGAGGTVVHYDGTHWSLVPVSGLTATLRAAGVAVDTTGAITDYFVVGDGGTILHSSDGVS